MSLLQDNYQVIVESYPDIAKKIKLFWGSQEFTDLMHDLLNGTRDHNRAGFSRKIVGSLITLQDLHDRTFPAFTERSNYAKAFEFRPSAFGNF
jgi:hypothetical protein